MLYVLGKYKLNFLSFTHKLAFIVLLNYLLVQKFLHFFIITYFLILYHEAEYFSGNIDL